jgi:hypothetical protein
MRPLPSLHKIEANERVQPLDFKDPFELCLKAKWTKGGKLVAVENGMTMAVSTETSLLLVWHKDPGVDVWDEGEYERNFFWPTLAKEYISGTVNRKLMFATLFMWKWYPERGDKWLNTLDVLAREVSDV